MTPPNGPAQLTPTPTRVRYSVLGLLCLLAMITYLDRAMYGSAKTELMTSVGADPSDFFMVLVAFQLAYALFEVPTGWLGDRFGPRSTLIRIVIWWSACIALTPAIGLVFPDTRIEVLGGTLLVGLAAMIAVEFMFGMGEAGAFPNISRAAYNWFPATQRGFAKGAVWMSARLAGGLTPLIWVVMTVYVGLTWRETLWSFAGIAGVWCLVFAYWFRNLPSEHPATNATERVLIEANKPVTVRGRTPWGRIFGSPNVWAVCLMYTVTNFNWYFLMYYLPGALKSRYAEAEAAAGVAVPDPLVPALLGGAPLLIGMFGCYLGGVLSDIYIRRTGDRRWGRRLYGMLGYGLAGLAYAAATLFTGHGDFWLFAGCLVLVGLFNDLIMGPAWATTQDIGGRYSAIVGGTMNMIGNLGATLGNLITGLILKAHTENGAVSPRGYVVCFTMYAVVYGLGVLSWLLIDPAKPIDTGDDQPAAGANA